MRNRLFFVIAIFVLVGLWGYSAAAFELQYPGEVGFFLGKPMVYAITGDSDGEKAPDQEGIFTFGQARIVIGGDEYYDSLFEYPTGASHFYLGLDSAEGILLQKGFDFGQSELDIEPAATAIRYPLSPGDSWSEGPMELTATNVEIPGLALFDELSVNNTTAETKVSSEILSVKAGDFDSLLVETHYNGSLYGIPVTVVQRIWLSRENVTLKRNFEFVLFSEVLPIYDMELSQMTPTPWDVNWDGSVNLVDVILVARGYGEEIAEPKVYSPDVNGDGAVDIHDLAEVGVYLGKSEPPEAPSKYIPTVDQLVGLETLRNVYQEAKRQSHQLTGESLIGLEKSLHALESFPPFSTGRILPEEPSPPAPNILFQNFPNPCNPETWIPYSLTSDSSVTIRIYSASGQLVRELALGHRPAGTYTSRSAAAHWDGENSEGEKIVSGIYFYTIRAGDFAAIRRMLVLD